MATLKRTMAAAMDQEAGYQAKLLRGGLHFGFWKWQYRIHQARLVTIPQREIGYVYARDGEPLAPSQTLARDVLSRLETLPIQDIFASGLHGFVTHFIDDNNRVQS